MLRKITPNSCDLLDQKWALRYAARRLEETGEANMRDAILLLRQLAEELYE